MDIQEVPGLLPEEAERRGSDFAGRKSFGNTLKPAAHLIFMIRETLACVTFAVAEFLPCFVADPEPHY